MDNWSKIGFTVRRNNNNKKKQQQKTNHKNSHNLYIFLLNFFRNSTKNNSNKNNNYNSACKSNKKILFLFKYIKFSKDISYKTFLLIRRGGAVAAVAIADLSWWRAHSISKKRNEKEREIGKKTCFLVMQE